MTVIDIHCHLATPASRPMVDEFRRPENEPYDFFMGQDSKDHNNVMYPGIVDQLTDPAARIEDMDRMGVDLQGLATFVSEYHYWAPADVAAESARIQNDNVAAAVAANPDRFVALGATVPLQDVDLAVVEMAARRRRAGVQGSADRRHHQRAQPRRARVPPDSGQRSRPRGSRSSFIPVAIRRVSVSAAIS